MDQDTIAVFEDDDSIRQILVSYLEEAGFERVLAFEDAKVGWDAIRKVKLKAAILDWKMPGLSGLALLNRLRNSETHFPLPILIVSGIIKNKDFKILEEYPLIKTQGKPFNSLQIKTKLKSVLDQHAKVAGFFEEVNRTFLEEELDAKQLMERLLPIMQESGFSSEIGTFIGKKLNEAGEHELAKQLLIKLSKTKTNSIGILTELGKAYLHDGNWKMASKILEKAQELSPDNVERICMLAKGSLNEFDVEKASEYFEQAAKIDPTLEEVESGRSLTDELRAFMGGDGSSVAKNFASMINALGISKVKSKEFDAGIDLYQKALGQVISKDLKSKIAFNIALGNLRNNQKPKAVEWLKRSLEFSKFEKAANLLLKIDPSALPNNAVDIKSLAMKAATLGGGSSDSLYDAADSENGDDIYSTPEDEISESFKGGEPSGLTESFQFEEVEQDTAPSAPQDAFIDNEDIFNEGIFAEEESGSALTNQLRRERLEQQIFDNLPGVVDIVVSPEFRGLFSDDDLEELLLMTERYDAPKIIKALKHLQKFQKLDLDNLRNHLFNHAS